MEAALAGVLSLVQISVIRKNLQLGESAKRKTERFAIERALSGSGETYFAKFSTLELEE